MEKNGNVIKTFNEDHNHKIEASEIAVAKLKTKIRKRAVKSADVPANIVAAATSSISATTSSLLPTRKSLCRTIQRTRNKLIEAPAVPDDASSLIIPPMFMCTISGATFLLHNGMLDDQRILIYSTKANLSVLKKCSVWQGDGTFDTVPSLFHQLYTIHGRYKNHLIY
ncbi:hypothetical protein TKK_0012465 [Trichogramma kaykai]